MEAKLADASQQRDELLLRVDQMGLELRKARMFAASQDYYIDRRLVANVLQVAFLVLQHVAGSCCSVLQVAFLMLQGFLSMGR